MSIKNNDLCENVDYFDLFMREIIKMEYTRNYVYGLHGMMNDFFGSSKNETLS